MAVVVFDIAEFRTIYPQFSELTDAQLTAFFEDACLYLDNTDASPEQNITLRKSMLYKITCHLLTLAQRGGGVTGAGMFTVSTSGAFAVFAATAAFFAVFFVLAILFILRNKTRAKSREFKRILPFSFLSVYTLDRVYS